MPRLKIPAKIELQKNTFDGEKRSETAKTAKTKVPEINPSCMALVRWAKKFGLRFRSIAMSEIMELPANQSEVHKNWETTITGNTNLISKFLYPLKKFFSLAQSNTIFKKKHGD